MVDIQLIEPQEIPLKDIELNKGQIPDVPQNPKFVRDEKYKLMVQSLREHPELMGFNELWVFPFNGKFITISGNTRLRALRELKFKNAPCKVFADDTPASDLRQYIFLANAIYGENDTDIIFNEFEPEDYSLSGMDFSFNVEDEEEKPQAEEDDFDEEKDKVETRAQSGDVWQLGEHRLICGDSTKAVSYENLMQGEKANMIFTDPPYNVAIGSKNAFLNTFQKAGRCCEDIANDKGMTDEECGEVLWKPAFENMRNSSKDDCAIYVTMPQGGTHMMMMMMMKEAGWQVKHELIWLKNAPTFSMGRLNYDYKHEPITYGWNKTHNFYGKGEQTKSVWEFDRIKCDLHPTMKPIPLIANALLNSTEEGMVVLDAFGGSGSTLMACEQLNRKCRMIEIDPHYCDVIIARWEKMTGKTAERIK